nr:MAG TPA: hypothetical protein [Caudoviricetes sp.]
MKPKACHSSDVNFKFFNYSFAVSIYSELRDKNLS